MKKTVLFIAVPLFVFVSCKNAKLVPYADDVYTNPVEERLMARQAEEERARTAAADKQKAEEERAARKAKDDANPYYKDPDYSADDYYDYQYASRINRFSNPVYGAGYYDPYYTNCYTYNQNPGMYGTSIYSTYNYWMPSSQFNWYGSSVGVGFGNNVSSSYWNGSYGWAITTQPNWGYGNGFNYGYWNNPMYGAGYGGHGAFCNYPGVYYGYNNGYYNGNYNSWNYPQWGYFNSSDPNSGYQKMAYAVRGAGASESDGRQADHGSLLRAGDSRQRYIESVAAEQENSRRFTIVEGPRGSGNETKARIRQQSGIENSGNTATYNNLPSGSGNQDYPTGRDNVRTNTGGEPARMNNGQDNGGRTRNTRITQAESDKAMQQMEQQNAANRSENSGWNTGGSGGGDSSGGGSSPRSSGGSGGNRPR